MDPVVLAALLPLIEALLGAAPTLINDVKSIIASIEGKPTASTGSVVASMAATDAQLQQNK